VAVEVEVVGIPERLFPLVAPLRVEVGQALKLETPVMERHLQVVVAAVRDL
jgi:hypothetical protein